MADALVSVILEQLALVEQDVGLGVRVKEEVQKLTNILHDIRTVFEDAERRQVTEALVKRRLDRLKDGFYDMENLLDEWSTAIIKLQIEGHENTPTPKRKVCSFIPSCFCFRHVGLRHDIAIKMKKLNKRLDVIANEKSYFSSTVTRGAEEIERQLALPFIDVSEVHGRDHDKNTIVNMLLSESSQLPTLRTISTVGMGGIGNTTLAQLVYNDDTVKAHFQKRIWMCVSDSFDEVRIAKAILEALQGEDPNSNELESPLRSTHNSIEGKKFLLVLDGVETEDNGKFEQLKSSLLGGSPGSRILVTTRKGTVAKVIGTIDSSRFEQLSNDDCWSLFSKVAFLGKSSKECEILEDIGRKIAEKCKGLPFATKVLGSLLCLKKTKEEWESVLYNEVWMLKEFERGFSPALLLSYYELSSTLRQCFSYCAIFPKDYEIEKDKLIKLWMAQDYLKATDNTDMEIVGEECFEKLAMHYFFHDFKKDSFGTIITCKMHSIMHDFVQFLTMKECFAMNVLNLKKLRLNARQTKARHSMFRLEGDVSIFAPIKYLKNLRSLIVEYKSLPSNGAIAFEVLDQFTCLRTLDFSMCKNYRSSLKKLPNEIGQLVHLRYLNLAYYYELKELPETICDLCNLQSLTVTHCESLTSLPHGLGKLIKLRHLEIVSSGISFLPKGFERLTSLRYLNLAHSNELKELSETICDLCNLQSLTVTHCLDLKNLPRRLGKLIKLRHLEIVSSGISFLPEGFERLTSLWYLNLAYNSALKELPETMCDLCNLQSLIVTHCKSLKSLPHGLGKLIKLRHLEIVSSDISFLPKGFERLTSLRTVDISDVSYFREASNMGDLKNIIALVLDFGLGSTEIIQPPPNLEELSILKYGRTRLPNWMMSLTKLRKVQISSCPFCELLPPLGELPSLESLFIKDMTRVKRVGIEFLGIESPSKKDEAKTSSSLSVIAFPELKQLHFNDLIWWKEWDYGITRRMGEEEEEEEEEDITTATTTDVIIMPRLHSLTIKQCPYLKALPDHILQSTSLKELEIYYCSNLRKRYYNERDWEGWPKIAHIPNIKIDGEYVQKDGVLVPSQFMQRRW